MPTDFQQQVYAALRQVPKGKVTTYKELGLAIGTRAFRAVGIALRNNPYSPKVPCHRVVASDGRIGGFKGETSGEPIKEKVFLLKREGVAVLDGKVVDFENVMHKF